MSLSITKRPIKQRLAPEDHVGELFDKDSYIRKQQQATAKSKEKKAAYLKELQQQMAEQQATKSREKDVRRGIIRVPNRQEVEEARRLAASSLDATPSTQPSSYKQYYEAAPSAAAHPAMNPPSSHPSSHVPSHSTYTSPHPSHAAPPQTQHLPGSYGADVHRALQSGASLDQHGGYGAACKGHAHSQVAPPNSHFVPSGAHNAGPAQHVHFAPRAPPPHADSRMQPPPPLGSYREDYDGAFDSPAYRQTLLPHHETYSTGRSFGQDACHQGQQTWEQQQPHHPHSPAAQPISGRRQWGDPSPIALPHEPYSYPHHQSMGQVATDQPTLYDYASARRLPGGYGNWDSPAQLSGQMQGTMGTMHQPTLAPLRQQQNWGAQEAQHYVAPSREAAHGDWHTHGALSKMPLEQQPPLTGIADGGSGAPDPKLQKQLERQQYKRYLDEQLALKKAKQEELLRREREEDLKRLQQATGKLGMLQVSTQAFAQAKALNQAHPAQHVEAFSGSSPRAAYADNYRPNVSASGPHGTNFQQFQQLPAAAIGLDNYAYNHQPAAEATLAQGAAAVPESAQAVTIKFRSDRQVQTREEQAQEEKKKLALKATLEQQIREKQARKQEEERQRKLQEVKEMERIERERIAEQDPSQRGRGRRQSPDAESPQEWQEESSRQRFPVIDTSQRGLRAETSVEKVMSGGAADDKPTYKFRSDKAFLSQQEIARKAKQAEEYQEELRRQVQAKKRTEQAAKQRELELERHEDERIQRELREEAQRAALEAQRAKGPRPSQTQAPATEHTPAQQRSSPHAHAAPSPAEISAHLTSNRLTSLHNAQAPVYPLAAKSPALEGALQGQQWGGRAIPHVPGLEGYGAQQAGGEAHAGYSGQGHVAGQQEGQWGDLGGFQAQLRLQMQQAELQRQEMQQEQVLQQQRELAEEQQRRARLEERLSEMQRQQEEMKKQVEEKERQLQRDIAARAQQEAELHYYKLMSEVQPPPVHQPPPRQHLQPSYHASADLASPTSKQRSPPHHHSSHSVKYSALDIELPPPGAVLRRQLEASTHRPLGSMGSGLESTATSPESPGLPVEVEYYLPAQGKRVGKDYFVGSYDRSSGSSPGQSPVGAAARQRRQWDMPSTSLLPEDRPQGADTSLQEERSKLLGTPLEIEELRVRTENKYKQLENLDPNNAISLDELEHYLQNYADSEAQPLGRSRGYHAIGGGMGELSGESNAQHMASGVMLDVESTFIPAPPL